MIYKIEPCPWCGNKVPGIGYEPLEDGWDERWYIKQAKQSYTALDFH